jgi:hypothetical protein
MTRKYFRNFLPIFHSFCFWVFWVFWIENGQETLAIHMNSKYSRNFLPIFHSFFFWFFDRKRIENVGDSYEQQIFQELFADISLFFFLSVFQKFNTPWAEGRPCIFYVCVREIRMTTRSLCLPCFSWAEYDACRFSWAEDDLWSELYMESQCRMIVFIRFAILHLFIYASLYPPASVSSPRGRLSCHQPLVLVFGL